jgi:hypothetical protein
MSGARQRIGLNLLGAGGSVRLGEQLLVYQGHTFQSPL